MQDWSIDKARSVYAVQQWSGGYFDIGENGHVYAQPDPDHGGKVDLYRLSQSVEDSGLKLPVLLRFSAILRHRTQLLAKAFEQAMQQHGAGSEYISAYPIKVNQRRNVVDQLLAAGDARIGIEVGSKAELLIALARAKPEQVVICNGYKDNEYLRLAALAQQLGRKIYIVIERIVELRQSLEIFKRLGMAPLFGIRVRLATMGSGNWQNSGGEKSKFGLLAGEVLKVCEILQANERQDCLRMMHFHMGSQMTDLNDIRRSVREAASYLAGLCDMDFNIDTIDVGGGLGIDYEGTQSTRYCSMNYSLVEYASTIVAEIKAASNSRGFRFPNIITEVGRAMSAHHAVLITNVIDVERVIPLINEEVKITEPGRQLYQHLQQELDAAREKFCAGGLSLRQRAEAEQHYFATCARLRYLIEAWDEQDNIILQEIHEKLADKVFCNFSLFQSLPDTWAIQQIFPVMPLHRLDETPTAHGIIQDITCDSDGVIEHYVANQRVETTLPLHTWNENQPYLLGIFLVGAYQETLGDIHNLFGRVNSVDVEVDENGQYQLLRPETGDDKAAVIDFVNYDSNELLAVLQKKVAATELSSADKAECCQLLQQSFASYTYLTS